jgi:ring-1,2-phenylacetyl-CoA epoxidase subunit PaaC
VPADLDAAELASYCLFLGDDALVLSHRLSEWCSNAPDLEDDIALANISLDLLGQARLLLARAAAADPSLVPGLPEGSPVPAEDALAFFREAHEFRNLRLTEVPNGDFAQTVARLLLFAIVRLAAFERLATHPDPVLSAIAAKGVKELAYHRDYAARWFVTLAQGTEESRRRLLAGLAAVWPLHAELAAAYDVGAEGDVVLDQVLAVAAVDRPDLAPMTGTGHTEALSRLLAEMQSVARAHPRGLW